MDLEAQIQNKRNMTLTEFAIIIIALCNVINCIVNIKAYMKEFVNE